MPETQTSANESEKTMYPTWSESDRLGKIGNRQIMAALYLISKCAVKVSMGEIRWVRVA